MAETSTHDDSRTSRSLRLVGAAVGGWTLLGLGIAALTLQINPGLGESAWDRWLLRGYALAGGLLLGCAMAAVAGLLAALLGKVWPRVEASLRRGSTAVLFVFPLLYLFVLPDLGWAGNLLSDLVLGKSWRTRGLVLGGLLVVSWLLGRGLAFALSVGTGRRPGARPWVLLFAWGLTAAGIVVFAAPSPRVEKVETAASGSGAEEALSATAVPDRTILLCVDGLDWQVLDPLLQAGELPTFQRLIRDGVSGPLATVEPTLSAVIWTTLATGKDKAAHGIHHFVYTRLPGLDAPILEFPLLTGLNFQTLPWLERLPFVPRLQLPYTSSMRQVRAVWEIVGRFHSVGVWKWLISWPAEKVDGFYVSGGLGWAQFEDEALRKDVWRRASFPERIYRGLPRPEKVDREEAIRSFAGAELVAELGEDRLAPIRGLLGSRVSHYLPLLIDRYDPRLVMAAFYNLDVFQHFYGTGGEAERGLVDRAYRFVDRRLGELVDEIGDDVNLIVLSDHGFDFRHGHHAAAPPGVFLAQGPAFRRGQKVADLTVFDVAPLVLRLLDIAVAADMKGSRAGRYPKVLRESFLSAHPERVVPTWEDGVERLETSEENPIGEELRDVLESLGYIG